MMFLNNPVPTLAMVLLTSPSLFADGISGKFTYTEDSTSVTISDYPEDAAGPVSIPSTIAGKPVTAIGLEAFMNCHKVTKVTVPNSVTRIDDRAFYYSGLTGVSLPDSLASIGQYAFYRCTHLPSVAIPDSVTDIGVSAFNRCIILTDVTLPAGLTKIPDSMFYFCSGLTDLVITPNITRIGSGAFSYCTGLKNLTIPGTVKVIEGGAFNHCDQLDKLVISEGVEKIKTSAFADCPLVSKVTIPASVTEIEHYAFRRRKPAMASATFLGNAPAFGADVFKIRHEPTPPETLIYYSEGATGFTSPMWNGYRAIALASGPEIGVQQPAGSNLEEDDKRSFGTVKVGATGGTKTFTIVSTGTETLTGLTITIDGADAGDFAVKTPNKPNMAPGESRIFTVTFKPKGQGTRNAEVHVTSTETTADPFSIRLAGMGVK